MKSITLAFLVTLYFVCTHINCNVNSNYYNSSKSSILKKIDYIRDLLNGTDVVVPLDDKFNLNNDTSTGVDIDLTETFEELNKEKPKNCVQNITNCIENDILYEKTAQQLTTFLSSATPPFDLTTVNGVSSRCREQSRKYNEDFRKFKLWALKMYDSSGKITSGILNGNLNQFGDFDMCLSVNSENRNIFGKYCLASFQMEAPESTYFSFIHRLIHSHGHFKSRLEDPGHRVPRFSSLNWALCVPSSCSHTDVARGLRHTLDKLNKNTDITIDISLDANMCQTSRPEPLPLSTVLGMAFFGIFTIFVSVATIYDFFMLENASKYLVAFSIRRNYNSLITITKTNGDIDAVHGIRFLNAILLVFAHKSMAVFFLPYHNRTYMVEFLAKPWTVIARAASLYTDPFIMMSGMLTSYSLIGKLRKTNKINIVDEYVSRLFRILPSFAALIAFCTFVLPWIGSGPMWNQVITHHSDICKKNWWRNLLFIHNYYGFNDMCLTHTHHVGIDTQLFIASPFLILILWKSPKKGTILLFILGLTSTIFRYYVTYTMQLSNYVHFGTSVQQLFSTADNMYSLPVHRSTVYIMGIYLGYMLREFKNMTLSKTQIRIGDSVALCSFFGSFFGPAFMGSIHYTYNPTDAAWYAAFAPILWCISFAWIIFSAHLGHKGFLGRIFSWPGFSIWTKISYPVYLTQFPIFFYNVGTRRFAEDYSFLSTNVNLTECVWIVFLSVMLTLLFEMPFQNLRNIIFAKETKTSTKLETRTHGKIE